MTLHCPRCASSITPADRECMVCGADLPPPPESPAPSGQNGQANAGPRGWATPPPAVAGHRPVGESSGLAIAGFVLSVLGLFCGLLTLPGLVLSLVALVQCRRSQGRLKGEGLAIAGLVVALVAIGVQIAIGAALLSARR